METTHIGFRSASGEDRVQLVPSGWPADNLPATTSSLLSVASKRGLIAAAGPDALIIATTEGVRHNFLHEAAVGGIKKFTPQATISLQRVSHVAFSSDESCLVVATEQGPGLAVYDTNALAKGNTNVAFELGTEGERVRQFVPNPNPASDLSGYLGVVTTNGKLLLVDLKERKLVMAANGSNILHENVSCACWSRLGKQIIAGLADGTAAQIDRQGAVKARIPTPPQITALPITSIFWLETDDFLIVHTPINNPDSMDNEDSIYHLAHRNKPSQTWTFNKLTDPCISFLDRKPANHFIQRLREWGNLTELLLVASTASADVGMFTRSKVALNPDDPIVDTWAETKPSEEMRAAMPMFNDSDTSPIGMALDLSVTEKISQPIPSDDMIDDSPIPLPALYVLNNEGQLSMWWIIYNEAVRQSITYPDMISAGGPRSMGEQKHQQPQSQQTAAPAQPSKPFGTPFGGAFATPATTPGFGQASNTPAQKPGFGQSSFGAPSTPGFGGTSTMGNRQSLWAGASSVATGTAGSPGFGKPSFGQTSSVGQTSFGKPSGIAGIQGSVWGTATPSQTSQQTPAAGTGSIFGGNASTKSPFLDLGGKPASSGFAAFSGGSKTNAPSPFVVASKPSLSAEPSGSTVSFGNTSSFGSNSTNFGVQSQPSFFGSPTPSATGGTFGKPSVPASREESMADDNATTDTTSTAKPSAQNEDKSSFGLPSGGFKLGSTFKGDGSAKDDLPKPSNPGAGMFGSGFGNALGEVSKASSTSEGAAWLSGRSTPAQAAIKREPGTEDEPSLDDIPAASQGKQEEKRAAPSDDAPLPPDPTTWKPKPGALAAPVPPGFEGVLGTSSVKESDSSKATPVKVESNGGDESLAGSPPIDLGTGTFSEGVGSDAEAHGPADDDEWSGPSSDGGEEEEGEDDGEAEAEDSGEEDDEDEDEEEEGTPKIQDQTGLAAFQARITPASPQRDDTQTATESTTPATEKKSYTPATERKESFTPAGMPKAPIMFAPPQRTGPESPRSPSPQRSATSPMRSMPSFNSQQQTRPPPRPLGSRKTSSTQQFASSQFRSQQLPQRIAVPAAQLGQSQQRPASPLQPQEPEPSELEDEEADRIKEILNSGIQGVEDVPAFLAHQDYVPAENAKTGVLGQIERVYRDINSMIDTLGLNARSMAEFVEGNHALSGRETRQDLEDEESWVLNEAKKLPDLLTDLGYQLDDGRLGDVRRTMEILQYEEAEINKVRTRNADARKVIMARKDPDQLAQQREAPLPMETQVLQTELRQGVKEVQTLIARAEEALTVLRAELASVQSAKGDGRSGVPTVEAVEKTIRKMTQMVEQRSGDVDVLESQIRRLGGLAALRASIGLGDGYEDDLVAGLKASRISRDSPVGLRRSQLRSSGYGSPAALRRSVNGRASTPGRGPATPGRGSATPGTPGSRRSLLDVTDEEVEAYRAKREARALVVEALRDKVARRGVRVVRVGNA